MSPEELREQGNASVRRLIEEHTDQSLLKTFDRSLREFERAASAPSAHMLRPRRRELCSAAGTEPVRYLQCTELEALLRASSALSTALALGHGMLLLHCHLLGEALKHSCGCQPPPHP